MTPLRPRRRSSSSPVLLFARVLDFNLFTGGWHPRHFYNYTDTSHHSSSRICNPRGLGPTSSSHPASPPSADLNKPKKSSRSRPTWFYSPALQNWNPRLLVQDLDLVYALAAGSITKELASCLPAPWSANTVHIVTDSCNFTIPLHVLDPLAVSSVALQTLIPTTTRSEYVLEIECLVGDKPESRCRRSSWIRNFSSR